MKLFDLHCDTPLLLYRQGKSLSSSDLHISLEKASVFKRYVQCAAFWSDSSKSPEECFREFQSAFDSFAAQAGSLLITCRKDLEKANKASFILSVEDARLLCGDIHRLSLLYQKGVRILTPLWRDTSDIGGAWNTEGSLTPFGKEVLEGCFDIGIIPDLSHASDASSAYMILRAKELKRPVIATHSNSRAVCEHKRNLTDTLARDIAITGGIIGISLYPPHLRGEYADISDIIKHIEHFINTAGPDAVCLGCDFDGIDNTPIGICDISDLARVYEIACHTFGFHLCEKIFFDNAYNFFLNNLPKER